MAVGTAIWIVGWYRVAERASMQGQRGPLNLAAAGVLVIGVGQATWFLSGRRHIRNRYGLLLAAVPEGVRERAGRAAAVRCAEPGADEDRYVGSERYFHRAHCPMANGRPWVPSPRSEQLEANRAPCGMCAP
jgi:hypothetical protein